MRRLGVLCQIWTARLFAHRSYDRVAEMMETIHPHYYCVTNAFLDAITFDNGVCAAGWRIIYGGRHTLGNRNYE